MQNQDLEILKLMVKELRPVLNDVDCVVEVSHRQGYETFSKKLRDIGFSEDLQSRVLCRFKKRESCP